MRNVVILKPIEIGINVAFMASWKSLINLKEIKKPSGKILRIWSKNQLGFKFLSKIRILIDF